MSADSLKLSVVVLSFNQLSYLQKLIPQLLEQDLNPADYEIIIVDGGSTDGTHEWMKVLQANNLKIEVVSEKLNRSQTRNIGIRKSIGDVVVMLDGDHTVQRDFLSIHRERHEAEKCTLVGWSQFAERRGYCALNHYLNNGGGAKLGTDNPLPGRYFLTRNCSVRKDLLFEIGLFDEGFSAWGGEDLEIGIRLEKSGIPIYWEPRALAIHHHHRPLGALMKNLHRYGKDGIPLLLEKHPALFEQLNLDHTLPNPFGFSRYGKLHRLFMRLIMTAPVYAVAFIIAETFKQYHLPRVLFDYLHLRQYTHGYRQHLRTITG